jgi:hypothetical protein
MDVWRDPHGLDAAVMDMHPFGGATGAAQAAAALEHPVPHDSKVGARVRQGAVAAVEEQVAATGVEQAPLLLPVIRKRRFLSAGRA